MNGLLGPGDLNIGVVRLHFFFRLSPLVSVYILALTGLGRKLGAKSM